MENKITHLEQYKMLREEILWSMKEISRLEVFGLGATASLYAWLLTHRGAVRADVMTVVPSLILGICALRVYDLTRRIGDIGTYLGLLEKDAFLRADEPMGWERYKVKGPTELTRYDRVKSGVSAAIWCALIVACPIMYWFARPVP